MHFRAALHTFTPGYPSKVTKCWVTVLLKRHDWEISREIGTFSLLRNTDAGGGTRDAPSLQHVPDLNFTVI